jgi:large subunit ribosomal protein L33
VTVRNGADGRGDWDGEAQLQTPSLLVEDAAAADAMAKAKGGSILVRLISAAGTGFFYVKPKNPRKLTTKLEFRKYDPVVKKHVLFTEAKMK